VRAHQSAGSRIALGLVRGDERVRVAAASVIPKTRATSSTAASGAARAGSRTRVVAQEQRRAPREARRAAERARAEPVLVAFHPATFGGLSRICPVLTAQPGEPDLCRGEAAWYITATAKSVGRAHETLPRLDRVELGRRSSARSSGVIAEVVRDEHGRELVDDVLRRPRVREELPQLAGDELRRDRRVDGLAAEEVVDDLGPSQLRVIPEERLVADVVPLGHERVAARRRVVVVAGPRRADASTSPSL
jgi:hypothetical protein